MRSLATRISVVSVIVALAAVAVIFVGVMVVAQSTFNQLMVESGAPAASAQSMFDHGVATIFVMAVVIAIVVSSAIAVALSARLVRPLRQMATAAEKIADGDYGARVPAGGPVELASLAESFNQMAESLSVQERERNDFIANASHELRTPLTNLKGYLEALRDGVIAPTPEQFRSLHEEAERLVRLSQSLDALADSPHRGQPSNARRLDVVQVVRSAYEVARPAFEARSIAVTFDLPERLPALAEPDSLAQVVGNLLQNASRYTPVDGRTSIAASARGAEVVVEITNSGPGIPAADLPRVFDRFYRVEKSRDAARGGAGIGLAIVKQLVEASGGKVGAESERDATRFWFTLPAG